MVIRAETLASYPTNLILERPSGSLTAPARAITSVTETTDALWIATKTYQLQSALEAVRISPGRVVPLLNGLDHVTALRQQFGAKSVVPGTIAVEAERTAPGRFVQRSPFVRLNLASSGEPLLGDIVEKIRKIGFSCQFFQNEETLLWNKLCFLAPFALVTSASRMNVGEILADARWNKRLRSTIAETCAVAKVSGAEIDVQQFQAAFGDVPPGMRSSMQKDLAASRHLELDAIADPIVRGGEHYGINVPCTLELMAAIRAMAGARG